MEIGDVGQRYGFFIVGWKMGRCRPVQVNRKTQADLNRKVRRRAAEEAAKKSAGRKEEAKQLGR